jgi:hypothetical protein
MICPTRARTEIQAETPPAEIVGLRQGDIGMKQEFTVGMNLAGHCKSVMVEAEDALIAALKVKQESPEAVINYVRRRNKRGDLRHPHQSITANAR